MPPVSTYPEAVHYATEDVLRAGAALSRRAKADQLRELLYGLATSIPATWGTRSRADLSSRLPLERIIRSLTLDLSDSFDQQRYQVLSSIFQVALVVKQLSARVRSDL